MVASECGFQSRGAEIGTLARVSEKVDERYCNRQLESHCVLRCLVNLRCPGFETVGHLPASCRPKWTRGDIARAESARYGRYGISEDVKTHPIELPAGKFIQLIDVDRQSMDDGSRNVLDGGLHHLCAIL